MKLESVRSGSKKAARVLVEAKNIYSFLKIHCTTIPENITKIFPLAASLVQRTIGTSVFCLVTGVGPVKIASWWPVLSQSL